MKRQQEKNKQNYADIIIIAESEPGRKKTRKQELQQINGTRRTGTRSRTNIAEERYGVIRQILQQS